MLHKRGAIKTTASRKLSAVKSFVKWLASEEIISDDTFQKLITIKRPKIPDTLPDVPSKEEMAVLLDGGNFPTAFPERDKLLCELMYGAGLRVTEAAHIKLDDLRPEQKAILIHGKGGPYGKNAKQKAGATKPALAQGARRISGCASQVSEGGNKCSVFRGA
jgi:site-specific recombinase XerD